MGQFARCIAVSLTADNVLQSDSNSCFLCIYANVCSDITDSSLIVFLSAFKNEIRVSSKMHRGKTTVQWSILVILQGQVVCMQITLLA